MPDIIQLLPEYLANQIAAGEVVQRPASVVKELLENAVDAGASSVQLIVKEAGKQLVQVVDNGSGMSATDARMSLERHATSKIRSTEDLFRIRTLGFRGEALASIAAVAQVEIRTKPRGQDTGSLLLVEGSQVSSQGPTACPDGTSISVKNLFFNVPARRNFLKSNAVEMRHILDEFQHVALANPQIAFSLYQNDLEVFNLPAGKLSQRIVALLGNAYKEQLAGCEEVTPFITVRGYIGKPESAKKSRGDQFFFVNNRFIRSAYLNHAVLAAYEGLLPKETHPFYVLFLELDPKAIDINVHPTKTEIKFEDEKTVYAVVRAAVRQALGLHSLTPSLDFEGDVNFAPIRPLRTSAEAGPGAAPRPSGAALPPPSRHAPDFNPDALSASVAAAARRTAASPASDRLPARPTEQARRDLEAFYRELGQPVQAAPPVPDAEPVAPAPPELPFVHAAAPDGPRAAPAHQVPSSPRTTQVLTRFVLLPVKSGLMLIDQEAARERILYEQYAAEPSPERGGVPAQTLLFPRPVTFSPADYAVLHELTPALLQLGFRFAEFGPQTIAIEAVPPDLPVQGEKELLEGLIEQFRSGAGAVRLDRRETLARALARRVAQATSQPRLPDVELSALVDKLFACQVPSYAPDGRPTVVLLDGEQLAALFGRP
ncbi:DNA mismatch repair endonuclease MutL [Hymenobacter sp. RP-2-7]|uniref:DNA mismatch repair protein MutL n=1 Tax=Hymenobacter polaris TaxID=2682546 RepID=A0A7Y0AA80_9BACT|nr:DNA mismatch repair endonuclease MutL [Hymenobacter polaris]NML63608.1 DNA mismatch repair endonuclease MutL [Hymenobacter polaris]